jgi:2-octaprenylphenol hydroxylase
MTRSKSHPARSRSDVCIVGNGAIAKTAALGFAQAGYSVTLLVPPAAPAPRAAAGEQPWDVRVYALNHTAHRLLDSLKVWGALDQARVAPVDTMHVNGDGATPGDLAFDAFGAHVGALAWIVEDSNLTQALDAALKFAPNVHIVSGRASALLHHRQRRHRGAGRRRGGRLRTGRRRRWRPVLGARPVRHRPRLPLLSPARSGH